jgi:hypothetical protein
MPNLRWFPSISIVSGFDDFTLIQAYGSKNYEVSLEKKDRTHIDPQATSSSVASTQEKGKVKLEVTISSLSNTFSKSDPVIITFSIANVGEITASILKWFIPSSFINADVLQGNLFSVNYATNLVEQLDSGRVPSGNYVGALIKRASPTYKDFLVLNPKQTHTVTFDLADYYSFSSGGFTQWFMMSWKISCCTAQEVKALSPD